MKKVFLLLSVVIMAVVMSSCLNDNNDDNQKAAVNVVMYNRIISADKTSLSIDQYQLSIDYNAGAIVAIGEVQINDKKIVFITNAMSLKKDESNDTYTFATGAITTNGGQVIDQLSGIFDLQKGALYMQFSVDGTMVYATSGIGFANVKTEVTPMKGSEGDTTIDMNSSWEFIINPKTLKANVRIYNFNNTTETQSYTGLTAKITARGYEITGTDLKPVSFNDTYTANNFKAIVSEQGLLLSSEFDCHDQHYTVTGRMFNSKK